GLKNTIPFNDEENWFDKDTAENAIEKAFIPGITAESNHGYASANYLNSCFGLAMVKQLVLSAKGTLSLATSDKTITIFNNNRKRTDNCNIQGIINRIRVDIEKLAVVDFEKQLDLVYKEAQSLDKSFKPSRRSQTL